MPILPDSNRLLFRPHVITDLDAYCAMEMDINIRRYVGGYPRTREAAEERFPRNQAESLLTDRLSYWATVLKSDQTYIGRCGLIPHFDENGKPIAGEAALGYYIAQNYWGQQLATEAGQAFIRFGFGELALSRIVATVQEGNIASVRVLEKLGFTLGRIEMGQRSFCHFILDKGNISRDL